MSSRNRPAPTTNYQGYPQSRQGVDPPQYNDITGPDSRGAISGDETNGGHRRMSIDEESEASSINEDLEVASITSSIEDQLTWRGRMQVVLHSHSFHFIIILLVVLDALIVLFELLLEVGAFRTIRCEGETGLEQQEFCHYNERFRDMCAPPAHLILEGIAITPEGAINNPDYDLCRCGFRQGNRDCIHIDETIGLNPALVLHYVSLLILTIFMVEIVLKLIAFGLKYFTHKFEVFDGIVVVVSWVLDVASVVDEEAFEAAALIIILRLWRVVRVVNGAVLSSKAEAHNHLQEARRHTRAVIHALHKSQDKVDLYEKENLRLREVLKSSGVRDPALQEGPGIGKYKPPLPQKSAPFRPALPPKP